MIEKNQFLAYRRPDGKVGVRNHVAIISTVACANVVAEKIAQGVPGTIACVHPYGCDQLGEDAALTVKILKNIGSHSNVGSVLIVGLGCEEISPNDLAELMMSSKKPIRTLSIQEDGGTTSAIIHGKQLCLELMSQMMTENDRVLVPITELIIGLECGGSDYTSGLAANPTLGIVADWFVDQGCKVIFGETTEILGAEHILSSRANSLEIKNFLINKVSAIEQKAKDMHVDIRGAQPSPGNIAGGLSSIEEKSLGAICKSGSRPIVNCVEFGDEPAMPGLTFMDTPGNDLACTCGLVAGGAHIVLFTTGRGTPMGFPIAPVIKVTANKKIAQWMDENIDIDVSGILTGTLNINEAGNLILDKIFSVAEGEKVAAEELDHFEFGFHRIGPTL